MQKYLRPEKYSDFFTKEKGVKVEATLTIQGYKAVELLKHIFEKLGRSRRDLETENLGRGSHIIDKFS